MDLRLSKHIVLITVFSIISLTNYAQLFAELEIGIINDKDGYTFIRGGKGTDFKVIDTLWQGDFFQYELVDTADWYKVSGFVNSPGFVHKSRIKNIESFSRKDQRNLIDSIFKQEVLCYSKKCDYKPRRKSTFTNYHVEKFTPILELFINYMNKEFDYELFDQFLKILIIENKQADELPSLALANVFVKNPETVMKLIKSYNSESLNSDLLFGVGNYYLDFDESEEYKNVMKILDEIKE